jgi:hypothetical protein
LRRQHDEDPQSQIASLAGGIRRMLQTIALPLLDWIMRLDNIVDSMKYMFHRPFWRVAGNPVPSGRRIRRTFRAQPGDGEIMAMAPGSP